MAWQLSLGLIVGGAVTSLPWLVSKMNIEALWPVNLLLTPGTVVAVVLSGNVHDYSMTLVLAVNVAIYALLTYVFLRARREKA